jgi:uroporphyrinogen-III synthase
MPRHTDNPVIITRPLAQAVPLAQRVTALGREAVVFPLLEIQPLTDQAALRAALQDLSRYAMVAFVSPNAIDAAFGAAFGASHASGIPVSAWPPAVAVAVVGEGSRAALAQHGVIAANASIFSPRDPKRTDSQTLLQALDLDRLRGKEVLIVRGETGRELLADELRSAGVKVTQVAAYRRACPELDEAGRKQLGRLLDRSNDWIVTSSEALRNLVAMAEQLGGSSALMKLQQQRLIVPHVRIAETAEMLGLRNLTLTGSGDEQLLAALQSTA